MTIHLSYSKPITTIDCYIRGNRLAQVCLHDLFSMLGVSVIAFPEDLALEEGVAI